MSPAEARKRPAKAKRKSVTVWLYTTRDHDFPELPTAEGPFDTKSKAAEARAIDAMTWRVGPIIRVEVPL